MLPSQFTIRSHWQDPATPAQYFPINNVKQGRQTSPMSPTSTRQLSRLACTHAGDSTRVDRAAVHQRVERLAGMQGSPKRLARTPASGEIALGDQITVGMRQSRPVSHDRCTGALRPGIGSESGSQLALECFLHTHYLHCGEGREQV